MMTRGFLEVPFALVVAMLGLAAPADAQQATFTDMHDLVPNRCFSAALSTVADDTVDIGIESGYNSSWINKSCKASTSSFHARSVSDTFTVTVTAPPGMRITRIHYGQEGTRYLERSTYWTASGTGALTVDGVTQSFGFTTPTLVKTVDLSGQNVESTTVSVMISMSAKRSSAFPRLTNPPGSASISVTNAVIGVEYE